MLFLEYPKCSTCRKAKQWLEEREVEFTDRNIREENPTRKELEQWVRRSGLPLKRFFNTSGLLYKELHLKERLAQMTEEEQLDLLASDGMLVRRPLLITEDWILIGFRKEEWEKAFG